MAWTADQQKVIDLDERSILVSAAAGSGKTAVLVERILRKITAADNPVDIDRLLVVTFTKAAAAEMRERISGAISKRLEENPEDENLIRQSSLVHNAQITTIDSFCGFVVRNHFGAINLDPNFRIADAGEVTLLENDILDELFEDMFENKDEDFLHLVDAYSGARNVNDVKDMVLELFHKSQSTPWPAKWLEGLVDIYSIMDKKEFMETSFVSGIAKRMRQLAESGIEAAKVARKVALAPNGPVKYVDVIDTDIVYLEAICGAANYEEMAAVFEKSDFARLPSISKNDACDEALKLDAQNRRNEYKEWINTAKKKYFATDLEVILAQNQRVVVHVQTLVHLTCQFISRLEERKKRKHIADFSDVEHFALRILVDEDTRKPSKVAQEFRQHFEEIMIDEYQDSNQVQEEIMKAISRMEDGRYNMFMVGDVKQSIYRFRQAKPELFMGKYKSFSKEDAKEQRIDLSMNFRSGREVLEFTNDIFYKIMGEDLGGVGYSQEVALYPRVDAPEYDEEKQSEILLFDLSDEDLLTMQQEELGKNRLEARMIAGKIQALMENFQTTDKKTGEMRALRYSDIVILLRSIKGIGEDFADTLGSCGIPAHVESSTGYFAATEVQNILNLLRILDNPYQDIPMAAVLKSPMVGLDNEELAEISLLEVEHGSFAEAALYAMEQETDGKLARFNQLYHMLRDRSELTIHELIYLILDETGYDYYIAALPAGERRAANVQMLIEKAIDFEKTSYKGLFHFVRYIEQLRKYEVDYGEADATGESADVVHIMSIHKSKGLEFPVVFVSGLSKQFNNSDTKNKMVVHPDLGLGLDEMQVQPRIKRTSLLRTEIADVLRRENLGEELRILYVAMTRAKDKLILTGTIKSEDSVVEEKGNVLPDATLSYVVREKAKCYLDWVLPAIMSYRASKNYEPTLIEVKDLVVLEAQDKARQVIKQSQILQNIEAAKEELVKELQTSFSYEYPYQTELDKKIKYSVSELKHVAMQAYDEEREQSTQKFEPIEDHKEEPCEIQEADIYVPYFAQNIEAQKLLAINPSAGVNKGALRGVAVHRVMECMDFAKLALVDTTDKEQVRQFRQQQMENMLANNLLSQEQADVVQVSRIDVFLMNPIAKRMAKAASCGELYKEKPFVMLYEDSLVQGIIDVFWVEEDGIVVLDYKTDNVNEADVLVGHYKAQLDLYADALSRAYGGVDERRKTKESLIYSFKLQEVITV